MAALATQRELKDYRLTVKFDEDGPLVDVADWQLPEMWTVYVNAIERQGWNAEMSVACTVGRPVVIRLDLAAFGSSEITSASLRALPIKRIVVEALEMLIASRRFAGGPSHRLLELSIRLDDEGMVQVGVPAARAVMAPQRGRRVRDDDVREVARVYREGLERGIPPTQHVQETLYLGSKRTAARYVERARQCGYLGPAPAPRVAGERSD